MWDGSMRIFFLLFVQQETLTFLSFPLSFSFPSPRVALPSTDGNELIQPSRFLPPSRLFYRLATDKRVTRLARARARAASIQYLRSVCSLHRHAGAGVSLEQNTFLSIQLPPSLSVMSFRLIFRPLLLFNLSPLFTRYSFYFDLPLLYLPLTLLRHIFPHPSHKGTLLLSP